VGRGWGSVFQRNQLVRTWNGKICELSRCMLC
jgi:hypothetical protein